MSVLTKFLALALLPTLTHGMSEVKECTRSKAPRANRKMKQKNKTTYICETDVTTPEPIAKIIKNKKIQQAVFDAYNSFSAIHGDCTKAQGKGYFCDEDASLDLGYELPTLLMALDKAQGLEQATSDESISTPEGRPLFYYTFMPPKVAQNEKTIALKASLTTEGQAQERKTSLLETRELIEKAKTSSHVAAKSIEVKATTVSSEMTQQEAQKSDEINMSEAKNYTHLDLPEDIDTVDESQEGPQLAAKSVEMKALSITKKAAKTQNDSQLAAKSVEKTALSVAKQAAKARELELKNVEAAHGQATSFVLKAFENATKHQHRHEEEEKKKVEDAISLAQRLLHKSKDKASFEAFDTAALKKIKAPWMKTYKERPLKTVLFIGGIHANELSPLYSSWKLLEELLKKGHSPFKNTQIIYAPLTNPDGLVGEIQKLIQGGKSKVGHEPTSRNNSKNIDLNRAFHGKPENQGEVLFIKKLILKYKPSHIVSLHGPFGWLDYDGFALNKNAPKEEKESVQSWLTGIRDTILDHQKTLPSEEQTPPMRIHDDKAFKHSVGGHAGKRLGLHVLTFEYFSKNPLDAKKEWNNYGRGLLESLNIGKNQKVEINKKQYSLPIASNP